MLQSHVPLRRNAACYIILFTLIYASYYNTTAAAVVYNTRLKWIELLYVAHLWLQSSLILYPEDGRGTGRTSDDSLEDLKSHVSILVRQQTVHACSGTFLHRRLTTVSCVVTIVVLGVVLYYATALKK